MCKRNNFKLAANEQIRKIFPPCPTKTNIEKSIKITMYDPKGLMENNTSLREALDEVAEFYNGLKDTAGLDSDLSHELAVYTFEMNYVAQSPTIVEIDAMDRMDFPMYVFNSPGLSANLSTVDEVHQIMEAHQIVSRVTVRRTSQGDMIETTLAANGYETVEGSWEDTTTLGYGFPGDYYGHGSCRKLGLLKLDAILNISGNQSKDKLKGVVKHELGHMLALSHDDNTIMNETYVDGFDDFTGTQIDIVRDTLKRLSPIEN